MRLHGQLGREEPDQEVDNLLADWRRAKEEGADMADRYDTYPDGSPRYKDEPLACPDCGVTTNDGERCGECLSYLAGFYIPEGDER